mmetsp:Transcript_17357/g.28516  ORF Transcript_17357/g.28516 Transcript_17357/m.28516 type:complete len:164 (+) Transcript_17357:60-551(+)
MELGAKITSMKRKRAESGEAETACPFLDLLLEDEIMVRIFSLLGNGITCLRTHSRVCKRFRSLMKNPLLWEQEIRIGAPKKFFATDLQMISPEISAYPVRSLHLSMGLMKMTPVYIIMTFCSMGRNLGTYQSPWHSLSAWRVWFSLRFPYDSPHSIPFLPPII